MAGLILKWGTGGGQTFDRVRLERLEGRAADLKSAAQVEAE